MKANCIALLLCLSSGFAWGQTTQPTTAPIVPPPYTVGRYNEDYSYLRDPSQRTDFFDPVKFVPFDHSGDIYATFGGEVRDRYEYFNNYLFGSGPQTPGGYNLIRLTENADVHFGPNLRLFVQGASAFENFRNGGPRPTDLDDLDLEAGLRRCADSD